MRKNELNYYKFRVHFSSLNLFYNFCIVLHTLGCPSFLEYHVIRIYPSYSNLLYMFRYLIDLVFWIFSFMNIIVQTINYRLNCQLIKIQFEHCVKIELLIILLFAQATSSISIMVIYDYLF